jgi:exportin-5
MTFLKEDIDTLPERHAFLGNYRRYCKDVIHFIVQKQPYDALNHILSQTDQLIAELYHLERPLEGIYPVL